MIPENKTGNRAEHDFYATHPSHVREILDRLSLSKNLIILEPCAGNGHIANVLKEYGYKTITNDLIVRGYELDYNIDFINSKLDIEVDVILTNPPFKIALEFLNKGFEYCDIQIVFLRLAFLESKSRKEFLEKYLDELYVYSYRARVARYGIEESFKKSTSVCYAWFVFRKYKNNEYPIIKWI